MLVLTSIIKPLKIRLYFHSAQPLGSGRLRADSDTRLGVLQLGVCVRRGVLGVARYSLLNLS